MEKGEGSQASQGLKADNRSQVWHVFVTRALEKLCQENHNFEQALAMSSRPAWGM